MKPDRIEILRARLLNYYRAEKAILKGQSYEIEGLRLTRADLAAVVNMIAKLEGEITRLEREAEILPPRSRIRYVVPVDGVNRYRMRRVTH